VKPLAVHTAVQITAKNFGNPHGLITDRFEDIYTVTYWAGNSSVAFTYLFHRKDLVPLVPLVPEVRAALEALVADWRKPVYMDGDYGQGLDNARKMCADSLEELLVAARPT
jgi:hypothetical protein